MKRHFDEHVSAGEAARQAARDAIMRWAAEHAPEAKVRELAKLIEGVEKAIGEGGTRSYLSGVEAGKLCRPAA